MTKGKIKVKIKTVGNKSIKLKSGNGTKGVITARVSMNKE